MAAGAPETSTSERFLRRIKRRCVFSLVVALICLLGFVASARRSAGLMLGPGRVGLSSSALIIGQSPVDRPPEFSTYSWSQWYADYGNAWRPFHAVVGGAHLVVIPLWQPMLLAAVAAAHAWGVLRGARDADPHRCRGCGYSLIGLPEGAEQRCPECGRPVAASGR